MKLLKKVFTFSRRRCLVPCALCLVCGFVANAAPVPPPPPPAAITMFATSADWEAITGMRMSEFRVVFGRDRTVSTIGTELYFLDGFPCFGQAEAARVWLSPATSYAVDNAARMRIVCIYPPNELRFAYRHVRRDAVQGATRGIAVCPVQGSGRDLTVNLTECEKTDWRELGR